MEKPRIQLRYTHALYGATCGLGAFVPVKEGEEELREFH